MNTEAAMNEWDGVQRCNGRERVRDKMDTNIDNDDGTYTDTLPSVVIRRQDLLQRLLIAPCDHRTTSYINPHVHVVSADGLAFVIDGVLDITPKLAAAMVREADLTPLAGQLIEWSVVDSLGSPSYMRRVKYTSRLPWPFAARRFDLESWFLAPQTLPNHLLCENAIVYISQSPHPHHNNNSITHTSSTVAYPSPSLANTVRGDVHFSGYVFVPLHGDRCRLRRVISVELGLQLMPACLLRLMLKHTFIADHHWMTSPPEEAVMRLQGKMETEPAYKAMFGE